MRKKLWNTLLISFIIIVLMGIFCIETNAQLNLWPAAISDPYASIFSGFGVLPSFGGTFGVTSLFGTPGSFLYPSYTYGLFDFDDYYWYWQPYPYDFYPYEPWEWDLPYFGVTSSFFPIYTGPPWWASALAFL
ncbi:MAG: hypothetical protein ACMUIU_08930 [bacterium]